MAASSNRGHHNPSYTQNNETSQGSQMKNQSNSLNQSVSYSEATQSITRNQAVVIDAVEGLTIRDYALAIGSKTDPANMIYISRISHGRICVYLKTQEIAEQLIDTQKIININEHSLEIRPLISRTKRITISNVQPVIPDKHIIDKLSEYSIFPKSPITKIKSGLHDIGYTHLLSFRRQFYIDQEEVGKLPPYIKVDHENVTFWLYLSTDKLSCFICKEEGHLAKHCKNTENQIRKKDVPGSQVEVETEFVTQQEPGNDILQGSETKNNVNYQIKRNHPPSSNSSVLSKNELSDYEINKEKVTFQTPTTPRVPIKKQRLELQENDDHTKILEIIKPAEEYYSENNAEPPIASEKLAQFLIDTYGKAEIHSATKKCTNNVQDLIDSLRVLETSVQQNKLRCRIKRILKKLEDPNYTKVIDDTTSSEE